jgi:hypothetical protein
MGQSIGLVGVRNLKQASGDFDLVTVVVPVVIAVVVAPVPVFFLFFGTKLAEIAVAVAVILVCPAMIVDDFVVVPHVIIGVVRVVNPIGVVFGAPDSCQ